MQGRENINMNQPEHSNLLRLRNQILADIANRSRAIVTFLDKSLQDQKKPGLIIGILALGRLIQSFSSASTMLRRRCTFEATAIMRLIFEQVAWVYVIQDLTPEKIRKTSPTKCISKLSNSLPYAGKLYGILSQVTHLDPRVLREYIRIEPNDSDTSYIFAGPAQWVDSVQYSLMLFFLLGLYGSIAEFLNRTTTRRFRYLDPSAGQVELAGRFLKRYALYQKRLDGIRNRIDYPTQLRLVYSRRGVAEAHRRERN